MLGLLVGRSFRAVKMKLSAIFLLLATMTTSCLLNGCGEPDQSGVPEAWKKLDDHSKLDKIKNMPLSVQQKTEAIQKLNVPEEDKQKAIAELSSGGGAPNGAPGGPPGAPPGGPSNPPAGAG